METGETDMSDYIHKKAVAIGNKAGDMSYKSVAIGNSKTERKYADNCIEIGNFKTYKYTVDFGENHGLKFLVSKKAPNWIQRKLIKIILGINIMTKKEDCRLNGYHFTEE